MDKNSPNRWRLCPKCYFSIFPDCQGSDRWCYGLERLLHLLLLLITWLKGRSGFSARKRQTSLLAIISWHQIDQLCYCCNKCQKPGFLFSFGQRWRQSSVETGLLAAPGGPDINLARISAWRIKVRSTHVLPLHRGVYTPRYARYMHSVSHFICHH